MFAESETVFIERDVSGSPPTEPVGVQVRVPNPARQGAADVVSMNALVRAALTAFAKQNNNEEFERALAKMINVNGAFARVIENGISRSNKP